MVGMKRTPWLAVALLSWCGGIGCLMAVLLIMVQVSGPPERSESDTLVVAKGAILVTSALLGAIGVPLFCDYVFRQRRR